MELNKKVKRRKFISAMGLLGLAGATPLSVFASDKALKPDEEPILKAGPYLQAAYPHKITVRWLTNLPCYSWVEFGETSDKLDRKAHTVQAGLIEAFNNNNAITLKNLQPAKEYFYRIVSRVILDFIPNKIVYGETYTSPVYAFKTPAPKAETLAFSIFNDIHNRPESFGHLMQYQGDTKKDSIFLNGDMINFATDENQVVNLILQPLSTLFATNTPFILSRGNHETRGKFARHLDNYFDGGENRYYFSFQHGPAYIIVLDSGEDKADDVMVYGGIVDFDAYRLEQAEWLERELQKREFRKAKYKIVFSHIPLYYSGEGHGTLHCREVWGPLLNKAKIDVLISGHTHKYGVHPPVEGQHNYPIIIGGGPANTKRTIINVTADQKALNLQMFDDSGKEVGALKI